MALRDWLSGTPATATPATPATHGAGKAGTVATVATVAVATRANPSVADTEARYWRWMVRYPDGDGFEARTLPEATYAEALTLWPGAAIQPLADDSEAA